jgi:hypothetical protein
VDQLSLPLGELAPRFRYVAETANKLAGYKRDYAVWGTQVVLDTPSFPHFSNVAVVECPEVEGDVDIRPG